MRGHGTGEQRLCEGGGFGGAVFGQLGVGADEDDVAVASAFKHGRVCNNSKVFKDFCHSGEFCLRALQIGMVAAVGYVEATGGQGGVGMLEELFGSERFWCDGAGENVADDDVKAVRREALGDGSCLTGADFHAWSGWDISELTDELC